MGLNLTESQLSQLETDLRSLIEVLEGIRNHMSNRRERISTALLAALIQNQGLSGQASQARHALAAADALIDYLGPLSDDSRFVRCEGPQHGGSSRRAHTPDPAML